MAEPIEVIFEEDSDGGHARRGRGEPADDGGAARQRLADARLQRQHDLHETEKTILTARSEAQAAEHAYAAAAEIGDFQKQAEASRRMSAAESKVAEAERTQAYLRSTPVSSGDLVEDFASTRTAPTADWLRRNRDWVTDPQKNSKLIGAHHLAVGDGETPDSPGYFAHIERTLGIDKGSRGNGRSDVARSSSRGGGTASVTLSRGEIERSEDGSLCWNIGQTDGNGNVIHAGDPRAHRPIGRHEMARRKMLMARDGMYTRL